jgi:hypothetical protein
MVLLVTIAMGRFLQDSLLVLAQNIGGK